MSLLTVFTAPKPFTSDHIACIQRNAIRSWLSLGAAVEVILIGEEDGLAETAAELGVKHLPQVRRNFHGTPLVSSIFDLARQHSHSPLLAYVNADILLLPDVVTAAQQVADQAERFLIVGQRWDLDVRQPLDFPAGWEAQLRARTLSEGRLHPRGGSDYFIYPRACFQHIPDFAIGRAGWDNWMIYEARQRGWAVVDATPSVMIVHQEHDYSHLPQGQPHYRLPETGENVRLAGGQRTIFTLIDSDRQLVAGQVTRQSSGWQKFWRETEIWPLVRLHSGLLANLSYAAFHPRKAYWELRAWLSGRLKG
ncbi:MAG: hypothetical protein VB089_09510 [Anaerolineaceae bacterium]|nr:hypothetical protein [Anaerolineaceae bacterium]